MVILHRLTDPPYPSPQMLWTPSCLKKVYGRKEREGTDLQAVSHLLSNLSKFAPWGFNSSELHFALPGPYCGVKCQRSRRRQTVGSGLQLDTQRWLSFGSGGREARGWVWGDRWGQGSWGCILHGIHCDYIFVLIFMSLFCFLCFLFIALFLSFLSYLFWTEKVFPIMQPAYLFWPGTIWKIDCLVL
jgi:hypothetical protein